MGISYPYARQRADYRIHQKGAKGLLRRSSGDRECWYIILEYSPEERQGKLIMETDRLALVSPVGLSIPPNNREDHLITFVPDTYPPQIFEELRIAAPVGKWAPAGYVVYWELQVRDVKVSG